MHFTMILVSKASTVVRVAVISSVVHTVLWAVDASTHGQVLVVSQ